MAEFVLKTSIFIQNYVKIYQKIDSIHLDLIFQEMEKAKENLRILQLQKKLRI